MSKKFNPLFLLIAIIALMQLLGGIFYALSLSPNGPSGIFATTFFWISMIVIASFLIWFVDNIIYNDAMLSKEEREWHLLLQTISFWIWATFAMLVIIIQESRSQKKVKT